MADELTKKFIQRMLKIMDERGLVPKDIIQGIGISQPSYSNWVNGGANISAGSRRKVADFLNVPVEYMETGERKDSYSAALLIHSVKDLSAIAQSVKSTRINPVFDQLAGESDRSLTESTNIYNNLEPSLFVNLTNQPGLFAMTMKNDSMYSSTLDRSFNTGDQVIFDPLAEPVQGECLLVYLDGKLEFRRWVELNGIQLLTVLNPAYTDGSALRYDGSIYDIWTGTAICSVKKPFFFRH